MKKNLPFMALLLLAIGCSQSNGKTEAVGDTTAKDSASTKNNVADFNVYYPNVQKIRQPDDMSCWAAAVTMLYSYKMNDNNLKIETVLKSIDEEYVTIFKSGDGISSTKEEALYKKIPLKVIKGLNPSIALWKDILEKKGPLSVTVDADPGKKLIHALVITGLKGDGTPAKTRIIYIDPADGTEYEKNFVDFLKLYEGSASWPLQIIHWP
jgi:hypothetical protein